MVPRHDETPAQFRCGLVADIQYADVDDIRSASGRQLRSYRGALKTAQKAVQFFNEEHSQGSLSFILHNGDIIDHKAAFDFENDCFRDKRNSFQALKSVLEILDGTDCRSWIFTLGNHEM
uniref:Calcineurin-like phosphoesterase domain-containing protein n=1 Tax=Tetraselmis sp. GSL018 TaxID=582737 RepID=A0A061S5P7_9CHLO